MQIFNQIIVLFDNHQFSLHGYEKKNVYKYFNDTFCIKKHFYLENCIEKLKML